MIESYIPRPSNTVEKLGILFSDIFIKYATKEDDDIKNVENGVDYTSFHWNVHHKDFVLDDNSKENIQNDVNKLLVIERDYKIHLKNHYSMPEFITKRLKEIEKILTTIKAIYPDVKISENLRLG